jgi:membrane protein DedA with SNARE-associated domain
VSPPGFQYRGAFPETANAVGADRYRGPVDYAGFITHAGYAALIVLGFLEAACTPISSEVTFGFAGVLAYQGHLNLALVIIIGSVAELAGSLLSYGVGRWGGRPLVDRVGRYVLITRADVDRAERFLAGRGAWAVPVGRMLPLVRAFVSLVAGLVDMPALRFGILSAIGTVCYAAIVSGIGYGVGSAWQSVSHGIADASYVIVVIVVLAIVAFVVYRLRELRREDRERSSAAAQRDGVPPSPPADNPGLTGESGAHVE